MEISPLQTDKADCILDRTTTPASFDKTAPCSFKARLVFQFGLVKQQTVVLEHSVMLGGLELVISRGLLSPGQLEHVQM